MAEFKRVNHAQLSPTKCVTCGDDTGPFIDLEVTLPVYGHLYLCAAIPGKRPGCVHQIARRDSMVEVEQLRNAERYIETQQQTIATLGEKLRGDKFVRLDDVREYLQAG